MKNLNNIKYALGGVILFSIFLSCSDDFLERPPKDSIVDANFYQTDDQLLAGSALLYNHAWFAYNDEAYFNLGDYRGGTAFSRYSNRDNVEFNTTANTAHNGNAWRAFFNVVGQSNLLIRNVNQYAPSSVSPEIKEHVIAEARFMRALAYRFLVMNWGPVPIIENNLTLLSDTTISPNTEESIWRFITTEMRFAAENLPETPVQVGRITQWSAEGMLARFYLTRSGVEAGENGGSRNQIFLDSAKYYSKRVIELSGAKLLENYEDLFKFPYDNNSESLFSLQWYYSGPTAWTGTQNSVPSHLNWKGDLQNGDGWGTDKGATLWMLQQYEGLTTSGRTLDKRLKATFMLPGFHYPELIHSSDNTELVFPFEGENDGNNMAAIKKYVTGRNGGESASQRYGHDSYMLRLSEMYLTYVEAELGNQSETSDPTALEYYNIIRERAGLQPRTDENTGLEIPIKFEDVFRERIIEFAMEGMSWYDFVSWHYWDPAAVREVISSQDRGFYFVQPDVFPEPTEWIIGEADGGPGRNFVATEGNFRIPIPAAEINRAPNLNKTPVDYYNK